MLKNETNKKLLYNSDQSQYEIRFDEIDDSKSSIENKNYLSNSNDINRIKDMFYQNKKQRRKSIELKDIQLESNL